MTPGADAVLPTTTGNRAPRPLLLLAMASGLGGGAATAVPTFLVPAGTFAGLSEAAAGIVLAVASTAGVVARIVAGMFTDRRGPSELVLMAAMLLGGSAGMVLLGSNVAGLFVPGAVLALGAGWGWSGIAFLAAVRLRPAHPARAAAAVLTGLAAGGASGPALFGWLVAWHGYPVAWFVGAATMAAAAGAAGISHRRPPRGGAQ